MIDAFYNSAAEFCKYLNETVITTDETKRLLEKLMLLYLDALHLPDVEPDSVERGTDIAIQGINLKIETPCDYWDVFDPYIDHDVIGCSLYDDLTDISRDLLKGISEYDAGLINNAAFEWKTLFKAHWGMHAMGAIRALSSLMMGDNKITD